LDFNEFYEQKKRRSPRKLVDSFVEDEEEMSGST